MSEAGLRADARNQDRRSKPRICVPFHATVWGVNNEGEKFTVDTVLDNMSGDGLYMRMMPSVKQGTRLSIEIRLHTPSQGADGSSRTLVEGIVLRFENKAGGVSGVAVAFDRVRFA